jgi:hypothetical protein
MPWFNEPIRMERQGALNDSWQAGIYSKYVLDAPGGQHGWVSSPFMSYTVAGTETRNFVYGNLNVLHNFSNYGENCAGYDKAIKAGKGPTWGRCVEVQDKDNNAGAMVGQETDVFAAGPAADLDEGNNDDQGGRVRVGQDTLIGDEKFKSHGVQSGAQGSIGHRIAASGTSSWSRWIFGQWITDYIRTGLRLVGRGAERAIDIQGEHVVGIDFSRGEFQSVMRVREGQCYSLDGYDDFLFRRAGGRVQYLKRNAQGDHVAVFEVDMDNAALYIGGKRVLTQ